MWQVSYENRIEELQRELRLLGEEKEKVFKGTVQRDFPSQVFSWIEPTCAADFLLSLRFRQVTRILSSKTLERSTPQGLRPRQIDSSVYQSPGRLTRQFIRPRRDWLARVSDSREIDSPVYQIPRRLTRLGIRLWGNWLASLSDPAEIYSPGIAPWSQILELKSD